MEWENALRLINKAYEKDFDKKVFDMWLTLYPNMDEKTFVSFGDYKSKLISPTTNTLSSMDDILRDVANIRQKKARKEV